MWYSVNNCIFWRHRDYPFGSRIPKNPYLFFVNYKGNVSLFYTVCVDFPLYVSTDKLLFSSRIVNDSSTRPAWVPLCTQTNNALIDLIYELYL